MNISWNFIYVSIFFVAILLLANFFKKRKKDHIEEVKRFWYKFMHFSCGFFMAMFWRGFFQNAWLIIVLTFLVGAIWEIGEYFLGIYKLKKFGTKDYLVEFKDTIGDLILDIFGAAVWISAYFLLI